ncbi:sugar ABC transporter permease [Vallitalea pronyensis]|uniref:Sugar ABC transporter permease n=2 Tax=Vallitalea pronyensis TaxID=1348613 RepID=A0A8J8MQI9_9FIRM|nr:sugar ABC transporter permease [Vallitalea pronyensis]
MSFKSSWQLYVMFLLPLMYILIFKYYPMLGTQIAFKDYKLSKGIWGSEWVGLDHFLRFFKSYQFNRVVFNTLRLSLYAIIAGFPLPIILAISLNYTRKKTYKKLVQMVTYMPHFISVVVMVGIILQFLNPRYGMVNALIVALGGQGIDFMGKPGLFGSVYVWSGVWQNLGYGSIIYLAALAGVSPELHEAAIMDGASLIKRIRHIDIPGIMPTAIILLIMRMGHILDVGFQKILLLQNPMNLRTSETIATYVYKVGLQAGRPDFGYATAIGLSKSVISLVILILVNRFAKRYSETSLW